MGGGEGNDPQGSEEEACGQHWGQRGWRQSRLGGAQCPRQDRWRRHAGGGKDTWTGLQAPDRSSH